jgi:hypothetical protein
VNDLIHWAISSIAVDTFDSANRLNSLPRKLEAKLEALDRGVTDEVVVLLPQSVVQSQHGFVQVAEEEIGLLKQENSRVARHVAAPEP